MWAETTQILAGLFFCHIGKMLSEEAERICALKVGRDQKQFAYFVSDCDHRAVQVR